MEGGGREEWGDGGKINLNKTVKRVKKKKNKPPGRLSSVPCGHVNSVPCYQPHLPSLPAQVSLKGQPQDEARQLPLSHWGLTGFLPLSSRTAVNAQTGVCTPAGGLVTGEPPTSGNGGEGKEPWFSNCLGHSYQVCVGPQLCPIGHQALGLHIFVGAGWEPVPQMTPPHRCAGAAVSGLLDLALLLHPQVCAGCRHHHGCGPTL